MAGRVCPSSPHPPGKEEAEAPHLELAHPLVLVVHEVQHALRSERRGAACRSVGWTGARRRLRRVLRPAHAHGDSRMQRAQRAAAPPAPYRQDEGEADEQGPRDEPELLLLVPRLLPALKIQGIHVVALQHGSRGGGRCCGGGGGPVNRCGSSQSARLGRWWALLCGTAPEHGDARLGRHACCRLALPSSESLSAAFLAGEAAAGPTSPGGDAPGSGPPGTEPADARSMGRRRSGSWAGDRPAAALAVAELMMRSPATRCSSTTSLPALPGLLEVTHPASQPTRRCACDSLPVGSDGCAAGPHQSTHLHAWRSCSPPVAGPAGAHL